MNKGLLGFPAGSPLFPPFPERYVRMWEQQPAGTNAGTGATGSYISRVLNQKTDAGQICVLDTASGQFMLQPGTYEATGLSPAYFSDQTKARLYNLTTGVVLLLGMNGYGNRASPGCTTKSYLAGRFTVQAGQQLGFQQWRAGGSTGNGLGVACNFAEVETYALLELVKLT